MFDANPLLNVDSYKHSHFRQYPTDAGNSFAYIEARGGGREVLFFGLQAFVKEYLLRPITPEMIDEAEAMTIAHGEPFNRDGWDRIVREYDGFLPIRIRAVPEGTVLATGNVLVTVESLDAQLGWVTSFIETALLRGVWYPSTVATKSHNSRKVILDELTRTADDPDAEIDFKLHDFGARGTSSMETAMLGGAAHLVSFAGTDTMSALIAAKRYYGDECAGFSIPAAEHSTITSWGRDGEGDAFENMLDTFVDKDNALVAVVSDSYDLFNAIDEIWGRRLKAKIEALGERGSRLVIRPDSGDPEEVVLEAQRRLAANFGAEKNSKGFYVLPPYLRLLQGDGITEHSLKDILATARIRGEFSASNVAFGMGGGLLQQVTRDDLAFAMKVSAIEREGVWTDVFKDPKTDHRKRSKRGRLALIKQGRAYQTVRADELGNRQDILEDVYLPGRLVRHTHFADIRARARSAQG